MHAMRNGLRVVAVSGFSANVGKTTVACRLLERLPGWEAIKVTKGHYRSCGKDPHACCVSHLLSDAPLVLSGRERTYTPGKDTGRYWDAGASNVHWVVATKERVGDGVRVGMPGKPVGVRHGNPAQDEGAAGEESVRVISDPHARHAATGSPITL